MTMFSTVLDGRIVTIVVEAGFDPEAGTHVQKFKLKENGIWKEIPAGQVFMMLKRAIEQGNVVEHYYETFEPYVKHHEPISSLEKLLEVWYI